MTSTMREYRYGSEKSFDALKLNETASIPQPAKGEIQIKFHAVSLNFRDLIIARKSYPLAMNDNVVPASDGAGEVTAVGEGVTTFAIGDRVSPNFNADHFSGNLDAKSAGTGLGGALDGCLREYGCFRALSCVKLPDTLSYEECATLPCAALTAWNGLTGSADSPLKAGQWVLVEGTGGVSVFGAQIALASGCQVILTSSSDEKAASAVSKITAGREHEAARLHTINYAEDAEWGATALALTGDRGVNHILEVGGEKTTGQALKCLTVGGQICVIGFIAQTGSSLPGAALLGGILGGNVRVRGILVGSVAQFNEMNQFLEAHKIKPVVDRVFRFDQAKEAYEYQWSQKHLGKVVVKITS